MPFCPAADLFPTVGAPGSYGETVHGGTGVLFSEGHFFQDLQTLADYSPRQPWIGTVPTTRSSELVRVVHRLITGQHCRVVLLGDSISEGCNASGFNGVPPGQPPYIDRLAAALRERFSAPVDVVNLSVGGKDSAWGATMKEKVAALRPDLVLLAFGMNDCGPAVTFAANTWTMVRAIQRDCPDADIILVAGMTGNPDLTEFPQSRFEHYRDALKLMISPGVAVADVTSFWIDLLRRKPYTDLTGNGVNHPNDFGHRVYADVIGALFHSP